MNNDKKSPPDISDSLNALTRTQRNGESNRSLEHLLKITRHHDELITRTQAFAFPGVLSSNITKHGDLANLSKLVNSQTAIKPDHYMKAALRTIENINNSAAFKFPLTSKTIDLFRTKSITERGLELNRNHIFSTLVRFQKEHSAQLSLLMQYFSRTSVGLPSNFLPESIAGRVLNIDVLSGWEKLNRRNISKLSMQNQNLIFSAASDFFSKNSDYFTNFTSEAIRSIQTAETDNLADNLESEPDAEKQFRQLPAWLKWLVLLLLCHLFLPVLEGVRDDIALGYLKEQCFTSYFCENKSQQATILTRNKPDELSYSDLNKFRLVKKHNVRLRSTPSMQGEIIEVLPFNQPLLIINRDNRKWLLIRTQVNGEDIEGWINRSYTRSIIK